VSIRLKRPEGNAASLFGSERTSSRSSAKSSDYAGRWRELAKLGCERVLRSLQYARFPLGLFFLCFWLWQGCSLYQTRLKFWSKKQAAPAAPSDERNRVPEAAEESNSFVVHIEYSEKRDFLRSLDVIEYQRAQLLKALYRPGGRERALVRFSGGTTVWRIEPKPVKRTLLSRTSPFSLLSEIPVADVNRDLRVEAVTYGKLPKGLIQTLPSSGPPDPLEIGEYYMVKVERALGVTNYQVVRLDPNGEIAVYDADPRAGDSYELCCDVAAEFFKLPIPNQQERRGAGDTEPQENDRPANESEQQDRPVNVDSPHL
jgi:hypothetical protein